MLHGWNWHYGVQNWYPFQIYVYRLLIGPDRSCIVEHSMMLFHILCGGMI